MRRIVTGDRPTGRMRLGHYVGSLRSRAELQNSDSLIIIVADNYTYGTAYRADQIRLIPTHIDHLLETYFCAGLTLSRITLYLQSQAPELASLYVLVAHLITVDDLAGSPSIQDMTQASGTSLVASPLRCLVILFCRPPIFWAAPRNSYRSERTE